MTIPVGVKDTDAAYALLNAYLGANAQAILTEKTSYTPINLDAKPKVDDVTAAFLTSTPERIGQGYQQNIPFWVKNFDLAAEKWNALLSGN
jgi:putative spermidine/putrescine transport system substrate-binding protein